MTNSEFQKKKQKATNILKNFKILKKIENLTDNVYTKRKFKCKKRHTHGHLFVIV